MDFVKPFHIEEAKTIDPSGTSSISNATIKTDTTSAVEALINAYMSDISGDYPANYAAAEAALLQLKTDIATAIDTEIPDNSTIDNEDVLENVKQDLETAIQDSGKTNACPQCATIGLVTVYEDDGVTPTNEFIECPTCQGDGYTEIAYALDQNNKRYVPAS